MNHHTNDYDDCDEPLCLDHEMHAAMKASIKQAAMAAGSAAPTHTSHKSSSTPAEVETTERLRNINSRIDVLEKSMQFTKNETTAIRQDLLKVQETIRTDREAVRQGLKYARVRSDEELNRIKEAFNQVADRWNRLGKSDSSSNEGLSSWQLVVGFIGVFIIVQSVFIALH